MWTGLHPWIGGRDERIKVRLVLQPPPAVVPETQPLNTSGPLASSDPAGLASEDRIARTERENVQPELRPNRSHQFLQQASRSRRRRLFPPVRHL